MGADPVKPEEIVFDEASHTYTVRGERWPGVTSILDPYLTDFSRVPDDILRRAREWGKAVHQTIELYEQNDLDYDSLASELLLALQQYMKAKEHMGWRVVGSEIPVAHAMHRYAGTLDLVAYAGNRKTADQVDVKTGVMPPSVGPQTSAYTEAYHHMKQPHRIGRRFCLFIGTESFKVYPLKEASDFSIFLSCLNLTRFKEKHRV